MEEKGLKGKRILMVIAPEEFRDEELFTPKEIFEAEGAEVKIASTRLGPARGMLGESASPDLLIADARADDYDAIVVVGGMGSPTYLWSNEALHRLLHEADEKGKIIGAICLSPAVLARAGLLRGRRATVYVTEDSMHELQRGGAHYQGVDVVTDGRIITASGPQAAAEFGRAICAQLGARPR
ncbi:MAG: DJ-1/PfpI family protein [Blastocatellia bacterium]|nr:DJ-1/PfpI family protein [Blastocatellia bacterium]MDW8168801.1 DJ-1/PfpI family protein [Acidobacteriota bacterium]